jgi:hypothetical protein
MNEETCFAAIPIEQLAFVSQDFVCIRIVRHAIRWPGIVWYSVG